MINKRFKSEKDIRYWCSSVIHHAAIKAKVRRTRWNQELLILNQPLSQNDSTEMVEQISSDKSGQGLEIAELKLLLKNLPEIEYQVLYSLFMIDMTQEETGVKLHISQQKVSRIKKDALEHLRQEMVSE